jgi:hypothetical protein
LHALARQQLVGEFERLDRLVRQGLADGDTLGVKLEEDIADVSFGDGFITHLRRKR